MRASKEDRRQTLLLLHNTTRSFKTRSFFIVSRVAGYWSKMTTFCNPPGLTASPASSCRGSQCAPQPLSGHPKVTQPAASHREEKGDLAWSRAGATTALTEAKSTTAFMGESGVTTELLPPQLPAGYRAIPPL